MQEQMNNVRRQIDTLRKYQRELLGVKNTVTNTNSAFYKLINRLGRGLRKNVILKICHRNFPN